MNNSKGFTLTELLAVIVIITVLSLIVIPVVNDQVNISKQKAFESSIISVKRAVQYYMDDKELKGENNEYIYNINVEDLKMSNIETLKGQVIVTKTETGYDIKYLGVSNGQFIYYGDSENGTTYKESDIKKDRDLNSSDSVVFENADPILISNNENIVVDDCYKNIIVKSNLTELEKSLSVIGGEFEMVSNEFGKYSFGAKVNLLKNSETVDAYDIIIAHGKTTQPQTEFGSMDFSVLDAVNVSNCSSNQSFIASSCYENGLNKTEELKCLYADFDYNRVITQDEVNKVEEYALHTNGCHVDLDTGLTKCG